MRWICLLLAAALGTAAPPAQPQAGRSCFWPSEVTGFSSSAPNRALVHIGTRETWELTLSPGCAGVDWAMNIGIKARGGQRICPGRHADLVIPDPGGRSAQSCLVRGIRKLSPAEAAAAR